MEENGKHSGSYLSILNQINILKDLYVIFDGFADVCKLLCCQTLFST